MKHKNSKTKNNVKHTAEHVAGEEHVGTHSTAHVAGRDASNKSVLDKNTLYAIGSIIAIFLIVYYAINFVPAQTVPSTNTDSLGYAVQTAAVDDAGAYCKLILGLTTVYDNAVMTVSLEEGSSTTYAGDIISVGTINDNGCVVSVSGVSEYLAIGQIQRIGQVYVTVKEVVN